MIEGTDMSVVTIISIVIVLFGIGLLAAAIIGGLRMNRDLLGELRGRWQLMTVLMIFFDVGFIVFVFMLMLKMHFPFELLVGLVLLGAAAFAFMCVKLAEITVDRMHEIRQEASITNEQLLESNSVLAEQIREREKISAELRKSKAHIENIFNNSIPLCLTNTALDIIEANDAYVRIFGASPAGKMQKCYDSRPGPLCHKEECPIVQILRDGASDVVCESNKVDADGTERIFLVTASPFRDEQGEITGIVESFQDVTKIRLAEEALAEEKERLLVTLKSIGDGVISVDVRGRVLLINDTAQALSGWEYKKAMGRELSEILHLLDVRDRRQTLDPLEPAGYSPSGEESGGHAILVAKDGWERHVSYRVSPIYDRRGSIFGAVLVFQDITEKLRVESEAARMQKLESVGLMAGGVAHDFNNILTAIMTNLAQVRLLKGSPEELLKQIDVTEGAVFRARELTRQLLAFARGDTPIKEVLDIGVLVTDCVKFNLRGSKVSSEIVGEEGLWRVKVDRIQMHQVISNLAINAVQAMPDGGVVAVSLTNCLIGPGESRRIKAGHYVKIRFCDNGQGISAAGINKIFDPYYTTKPEGNGLGLATVYLIISKHGGYVFVDSKLGKGTEFTIYLPAESGAEKVALPGKNGAPEICVGGRATAGGRILIMDDENDIRELLSELLKDAGFEVASACDGDETIRLYREALDCGNCFDCIIMDITIPGGMGGKDAISALLKISPDVKAIVSSGYASNPVMANYQEYGFVGRIAKPYRIEALIEMLNGIVASGVAQ
jgi:PAS domain S-box-containing protein